MFKDYYKILGISFGADSAEIKKAYRAQSLKWHPDKHPDEDVKSIMQDINEAYAVLKDPVKKSRYDQEYLIYLNYQKQQKAKAKATTKEATPNDYKVKDENVEQDMKSAREYAENLVDEFFKEFARNSKIAAKGAWEGVKGYVYALFLIPIIFALIRACIG